MLDALDLSAITDPAAREIIAVLVQVIEAQAAEIAGLKETVQQLRDENARLKGEQGKPTIRPRPAAHSSEQERPADRPRPHRALSDGRWWWTGRKCGGWTGARCLRMRNTKGWSRSWCRRWWCGRTRCAICGRSGMRPARDAPTWQTCRRGSPTCAGRLAYPF